MAIDEAILESHIAGETPTTLRLYSFDPPTLSLGYAQKLPETVSDYAVTQGLDIVRRPTGGRAVLHLSEMTYSFAGSTQGGLLSASVNEAYKQICQGLIAALKILGVELEMGSANKPYKQLHDCFLATTGGDLHYKGRKMIGSAQLRRREGVLQHGSLLLNQDKDLAPRVLSAGHTISGAADNAGRHANLVEVIAREPSFEELQDAFKRGFEEAFEIAFQISPLTPAEITMANKLVSSYRVLQEAH